MELLDYRNFISINEAKKSKNKKLAGSKVEIPLKVQEAAEEANKVKDLASFVDNLPKEAQQDAGLLMEKLEANDSWRKEFIEKLWNFSTKDLPTTEKDQNKPINPDTYKDGSVGGFIFNLKPSGMGRGEIFLSWLLKDSKVQGPRISFDLMTPDGRFEVKDARSESPNASIRLGGTLSQSLVTTNLMREIRKTLDLITRVQQDIANQTPKRSLRECFRSESEDFKKDFIESLTYLEDEKNYYNIEAGTLITTSYDMLKKFYTSLSKVKYVPNVYNTVILKGGGVVPREYAIKPVSPEAIDSGKFNIELLEQNEESHRTFAITELRKINYVRNPDKFDEDFNNYVLSIVQVPIIVFRPDGITIPKREDWRFYSSYLGRTRIILKDQEIPDEPVNKTSIEDDV